MNYLAFIIVIPLVLLVSCAKEVPSNKICSIESDCVPATCCHPKEAVNLANAPDCKGTMCTFNCEPETLDCGQGEIKCVNQECITVIK